MSSVARSKKTLSSLIEALYGTKHFNVAACSGDEIDNDSRTGVTRSDGRGNTGIQG